MSYTIDRTVTDADFDAVDERLRAALAEPGFGVLTEIDVKATMKKKLDADMEPYRILGACNPKMALKAIGLEPRVGAMLRSSTFAGRISSIRCAPCSGIQGLGCRAGWISAQPM
jgi:Domain of unknown function DUF302